MTVELAIILSLCAVFLYVMYRLWIGIRALEVLLQVLLDGPSTPEAIRRGIESRLGKRFRAPFELIIARLLDNGRLEVIEGEKGKPRVLGLTEEGEEGAKALRDVREMLSLWRGDD